MTIEERSKNIIHDIKMEQGKNPVKIFEDMISKEYICMHGPEHHILDGACLLVAFKNAGGNIELETALSKLKTEGLRMPGAMCGLWGVCGAVTSIGAALAIIDGTGPLTVDGSWGKHMDFSSAAVAELGKINGPRCCKRDARIALKNAVRYVNEHYNVELEYSEIKCEYSEKNEQCIKERCPFYE